MTGRLVTLEMSHAEALESFLVEFDPCPDELHGYFCDRDWPVARIVTELAMWGRGEGIKPGWVPCSTWFWEEAGVLQGVINVRHRLSPQLRVIGGHVGYAVAPSHRRKGVATAMLAAVLPEVWRLGVDRALLTCDADNVASALTIERNGGVLDREAWVESEGKVQRWYWIPGPDAGPGDR